MSKEAMKLALEAFEQAHDESLGDNHFECRQILMGQITALREALAEQPAQQQGPVAIVAVDGMGQIQIGWIKKPQHNDKLYTSPPAQRKPLTPEQVKKAMMDAKLHYCGEVDLLLTEAIEAAHGIKENT